MADLPWILPDIEIKEAIFQKDVDTLKTREGILWDDYWTYLPYALSLDSIGSSREDILRYLVGFEEEGVTPGWQWLVSDEALDPEMWTNLLHSLDITVHGMFTACISNEFSTAMQRAAARLKALDPAMTDSEWMQFYRLAENMDNSFAMDAINTHMGRTMMANTPAWIMSSLQRAVDPSAREIEGIMAERLVTVNNLDSSEIKFLESKLLANRVLGDTDTEKKAREYISTLPQGVDITASLNVIAFILKRDANLYSPVEVDALISTPLTNEALVANIPHQELPLFRVLSFAQDPELCRWLGPANPFSDFSIYNSLGEADILESKTDLVPYGEAPATIQKSPTLTAGQFAIASDPTLTAGQLATTGSPIQEPDECVRYGGCRMLLCNHFGGYDEEIIELRADDWFTGECEYCAKTIKKRSHALRIPLVGGGWYGIFCVDLRCILRALIDKFPEIYIRKAHERLLAGMLDILMTTGIYDTA